MTTNRDSRGPGVAVIRNLVDMFVGRRGFLAVSSKPKAMWRMWP